MTGPLWAIRRPRNDCERHRPALLELVHDPLGEQLTPSARAHLDLCSKCRAELADLVLTDLAIRRSVALARDADPPADAWPTLRARLLRRRSARTVGRLASPVLSVVLGAGLSLALFAPIGMPMGGQSDIYEAGIDPVAIAAADRRDAADEARQLRAIALASRQASSDAAENAATTDAPGSEGQSSAAGQVPPRSHLSASAK